MTTLYAVTVDTEEQWQWDCGWPTGTPCVSNIGHLAGFQELCERHGAAVTYFTNYAVLDNTESCQQLLEIAERPNVEIGMHIHPWNTPPIVDLKPSVSCESFLSNLRDDLALAKLNAVYSKFAEQQLKPTSFRGGRYSSGGIVHQFLKQRHFLADASVVPFTTWADDGAPDYRSRDLAPLRHAPQSDGDLPFWEIPLTMGFSRRPFRFWHRTLEAIERSPLRKLRLIGIADRLNLIRRVWLNFEDPLGEQMLPFLRFIRNIGVSFVENGRVVFACGEERLSRTKLQGGFPHRSLQLGLERTGWALGSIDAVAYAFFDGDEEARLIRQAMQFDQDAHHATCTRRSLKRLSKASNNGYTVDRRQRIPGLDSEDAEFAERKPWGKRFIYDSIVSNARLDWLTHRNLFKQWSKVAIADHQRITEELEAGLAEYNLSAKLRRFRHHDTHAANSFYSSGYDEALLVTFDGYGSGWCGGIYVGKSDGIELLHHFDFPGSLGIFYEHVTSALGFTAGRHEGKVVGLAAYGDPKLLEDVLLERFECKDGDIRIRGGMNYFLARAMAQRFAKRDVAAVYQHVLENVIQKTVSYWVQKTGHTRIAVSGGVHANVKLNQRIHEIDGVESVFVYPNMGDGGCATGAALLAFEQKSLHPVPLPNAYHGPEFSDQEMAAALAQEGLTAEADENVEERIAELLTKNHIVARFNGRMEYGPRALGNRSILYPAHDPEVNQWLNHQLGRTEFMPFAPAAMAEHAKDLFFNIEGCEKAAEFMTITFDCTDAMKRMCPAAVHIDGTARPQLVSEQTNQSFYAILREFYESTGIPALINTSFNMHEEPIVCTPQDATRAFLQGNIDYLAMGPYVVAHPRLQMNIERRQRQNVENEIENLQEQHGVEVTH